MHGPYKDVRFSSNDILVASIASFSAAATDAGSPATFQPNLLTHVCNRCPVQDRWQTDVE